jgi:hypothetical protein
MVSMRIIFTLFFIFIACGTLMAQQILAGVSETNITPKLPAALQGQFHLRTARNIESRLTANAISFESIAAEGKKDTAVFVACDLTFITAELTRAVRDAVSQRIKGFSTAKIIITATHTHTVPVYAKGPSTYPVPASILQPRQYFDSLTVWLTNAIEKSWKNRQTVSLCWGLGKAVVAYNRRASYADGRASMYGNTNTKDFMNIEGYEDHDVNALYILNKAGQLIAVGLTVPCPSQEVEGNNEVNADYWHDVRIALKKRWGKNLVVVGWAGASGDQSSHLMYRAAAENRMSKLAGRTRMQEIAHRIDQATAEIYNLVKKERHAAPIFKHIIDTAHLPARKVTAKEYAESKRNADTLKVQLEKNDQQFREKHQTEMLWYQDVVDRYLSQQKNPDTFYTSEIHALRIGDIGIVTDDFELFTDYGIRIQARSKALQTFVVQLANGYHIYLPTAKAVQGGSYSAIIQSSLVGPDGGKMLVEKSVKMVNELF